jgi:carbon storage regulator
MLVLARRLGESIVIDGQIQITVVAIKGNCIRLGFTAAPDVVVDRQEVHERRSEFSQGKDQLNKRSAAAMSRLATHSRKLDVMKL